MVQIAAWTTGYRVSNALVSDTEESVVGTQWHQEASSQLADMLRDVAVRRSAAWGVCEWITLVGLRHEDGTSYDPTPDVMVLRQPLAHGSDASVRIDRSGPPLFVAEIASESTRRNDQGEKMRAYEAIEVPEYLIFDPEGGVLPAPLMAWRLHKSGYVPWEPDAAGWWHSTLLEVAFQPAIPLLRVRDRDGQELAPSGVVRRRTRELEQLLTEEERRRAALEAVVRRYRDQFGALDPDR